ncbi:MAG TPA: dockerin type I domain-containing protein, partial [Chthoniobacterales bacterium]|nr:dockerin type I domain-containing protein [Chthoniobacterales bacterium]
GANGSYTIVFTFAIPLTSVGSAQIMSGIGIVSSSMIDSSDARRYIVNLTNVTNAQFVTVNLANVSGGSGLPNVSTTIGFLAGDTTGNGVVNSSDIAQTQSQSGQSVTVANFREDVTANGSINSSDIAFVQAHSGTAIPNFFAARNEPLSRVAVPDAGASGTLFALSMIGLLLIRRKLATT